MTGIILIPKSFMNNDTEKGKLLLLKELKKKRIIYGDQEGFIPEMQG